MPIYKDQKAQKNPWYFVFYTGEVNNGKRKRIKRRGFKTKKLAETAEAAARTDMERGGFTEPSKTMYSEYINDWLKNKRKLSAETTRLYKDYLRLYIIPGLGKIPLGKLNANHIENFLTHLKEKGLADTTIKRIFSVINASLNAAEKKDLIPKNAANKVEKPSVQPRSIVVWDADIASKFLEETKEKSRYWIAIYLAILTGMRQGEIMGLRWSDIDFEKKALHIQQTMTRDRVIKPGAKNKSSVRSVALSTDTIKKLEEHRKIILQERVKEGPDYQNNDLVICTATGGPASTRNIYKAWERLRTNYDVPHITFHDLRHTHASMLIKQNVHIKVISERLGHSSVAITMDLYGHLLPNMQSDAAESIDALLMRDPNN